MSDHRHDPDSRRYARYWEPVLAPGAHRLLDRIVEPPSTSLDIGAGTGALTLALAARWPATHILGLDASSAMLAVARERVASERPGDDPHRFTWICADALAMPLEDASVDLAVSSFVLQLVGDRRRLLDEVLRVLRPGGTFGFVTWLADELVVGADAAYLEAVTAVGHEIDEAPFRPPRGGDFQTLQEARTELRAAGFARIDVRPDRLSRQWSPAQYLEFKEHFDDSSRFDALGEAERDRLRTAVRSSWSALPPSAFELRAPLVSALARRPG
jgi:ubiquinone/menaquinone biosynthesis C-methylase UbiE